MRHKRIHFCYSTNQGTGIHSLKGFSVESEKQKKSVHCVWSDKTEMKKSAIKESKN